MILARAISEPTRRPRRLSELSGAAASPRNLSGRHPPLAGSRSCRRPAAQRRLRLPGGIRRQGRRPRNLAQPWLYPNLGYPDPAILYNPDFVPARVGHGFDWRIAENPGVAIYSLDTPPALRISFRGTQPEACEVLRQYVSVQPGRHYTLHWESRGIASGVFWHAGPDSAPLRGAADWTRGDFRFIANRAPLTLTYARPIGEPRVEGSVELRHVSIEEAP